MRFPRGASLSGLVLVVALRTPPAGAQASASETRVFPSVSASDAFSGQIEYSFDAALNRTRARFKVSLDTRNALRRILLGSLTVHTLIAAYEFQGRTLSNRPASVRVTFESDEVERLVEDFAPRWEAVPVLILPIGDTVMLYPLAIAEEIDELIAPTPNVRTSRSSQGESVGFQQLPIREIHIRRRASAWIPLCDFFVLASANAIRGTVAGLDFRVNEKPMAGLREFAAEINQPLLTSSGSPTRQAHCNERTEGSN
ncbi:MAG: hypothetical protein ABI408_02955 [Gemmatimonadaceae bacterium]